MTKIQADARIALREEGCSSYIYIRALPEEGLKLKERLP